MMIATGQHLPEGLLYELPETTLGVCMTQPAALKVSELAAGKNLVIFAVPGAFTPTCSAQHLPGFIQLADAFRQCGIDEIWCISVNDAYVMQAWGLAQQNRNRVRLLADGAARWTMTLGLEQDASERGLGLRSERYAMIVHDGVVKYLAVEAPGQFEVSRAERVLQRL
ncbi:MAG: peroxiredoxin [Burkholderiales bacterium]